MTGLISLPAALDYNQHQDYLIMPILNVWIVIANCLTHPYTLVKFSCIHPRRQPYRLFLQNIINVACD